VDAFIWVVICATALSSFFALTGYALRASRRAELEAVFIGEKGKRRLDRLNRHLSALRLMMSLLRSLANITLVVAMVGAFGVSLSAPGHDLLAPMAIAIGLIAVLGVAIPHAWAEAAGERILLTTLGPIMVLRYLLWPILFVMQAFDLPIRRLSGASDVPEENGEAAKQEILQAASDGHAEGAVDAEEVEMIESVMELDETHAAEIMTPRTDVFAMTIDTTFQEACAQITEFGHTRVPIFEEDLDKIVGILYAKDLLQFLGAETPPTLRSIMHKPYFVPESKMLDELLTEFKTRKQHLAVVLDEYGGTAGLVTFEDILEEIVGEIDDEYDKPEPEPITQIDERTVEIDGRVHVDDLNDALKLGIPEDEDYDTAAGLVISELGYIPVAGEDLFAYNARLTVLEADERKITRLRVEALEAGEADEAEG
jgi:putative hemolysin